MRRARLIAPPKPDSGKRYLRLGGLGIPRASSPPELAAATHQLRGVAPMFAVLALTLLVGAPVTLWTYHAEPSTGELVWLATAAILGVAMLRVTFVARRPIRDIVAMTREAVLESALLGGLAGALPPAMPDAVPMAALIVGVVALGAMPLAAMAFVIALAATQLLVGGSIADSAWAWTATIGAAGLSHLVGRHRAEADAIARGAASSGRSQRLAQSFEACAGGWFWETDTDGKLIYVSPAFIAAIGAPGETLTGKLIVDLVDAELSASDAAGGNARTLGFHLGAQLPFHEVVIPVRFPAGIFWWSLSGKPNYDEIGEFAGFSGIGADLTDIRRSEDEALRLARFDSLTGLLNRATIRETLETSLRAAGTGAGKRCALFLLDLDRFKTVNDSLGHQVGDQLLQQVAERLSTLIGAEGRVGRLGGDEFAVVVHRGENRKFLNSLAGRIVEYVSAPYTVAGQRIVIGATIGVAVGPGDGHSVDALMRNADLALYAAKGEGRGRYGFYRPEMHKNADARRRLETELALALSQGELALNFQPLVDANSEMLVGFETLIRWHHSELGDIPPARFIPIAEETGLIETIGEWVIRSACFAAARWPKHVSVAVNLSPVQFSNPNLAGMVMNALANARLPAERLELEVTEGVFLQESATTRATLQQLNAIGVKLTLDDFGTGYSSLAYLHKAPFHKIKIDRAFVNGASARDGQKAAIVRAIVALADSFGMATTAEGAETHDDLETVRRIGCTQVQGYIFSPAVGETEALRLALSRTPLAPQGYQATREKRVGQLRHAQLRVDGELRTARLRNASRTGAMFEAVWLIAAGDRLDVVVDGAAPRPATVRWSENGRFGVLFDDLGMLAEAAPVRSANAA